MVYIVFVRKGFISLPRFIISGRLYFNAESKGAQEQVEWGASLNR